MNPFIHHPIRHSGSNITLLQSITTLTEITANWMISLNDKVRKSENSPLDRINQPGNMINTVKNSEREKRGNPTKAVEMMLVFV